MGVVTRGKDDDFLGETDPKSMVIYFGFDFVDRVFGGGETNIPPVS